MIINILNNVIFKIAFIILISYIIINISSKLFDRLNKNNLIHIKFMKSIVCGAMALYTVYIVGSMIPSLKGFITTIVASTSLLVVVAGFAAQEALSNVLNGLMISIFKPFNIGDRVHLITGNITGFIEDITLRHTVIKTFTNSRIIVPNSVINKEIIENSYYYEEKTSIWIDTTVDYSSDISKVKEIIQDVIKNNALVLKEHDINVLVRDLSLQGVCLRVQVWTKNIDDSFQACSDIRQSIKLRFDIAGIKLSEYKIMKGDN